MGELQSGSVGWTADDLLDSRVPDVCHAGRLDRLNLSQLGHGLAEVVEQPGAGSEKDRHDGDHHLVEETRALMTVAGAVSGLTGLALGRVRARSVGEPVAAVEPC